MSRETDMIDAFERVGRKVETLEAKIVRLNGLLKRVLPIIKRLVEMFEFPLKGDSQKEIDAVKVANHKCAALAAEIEKELK